jgi:hypothetical protein
VTDPFPFRALIVNLRFRSYVCVITSSLRERSRRPGRHAARREVRLRPRRSFGVFQENMEIVRGIGQAGHVKKTLAFWPVKNNQGFPISCFDFPDKQRRELPTD